MSSPSPSQAELVVLKHLWSAGPQSAREVQTRIQEDTGWSYSTTRTLLARMTEKGLIAREDVHGLSVFAARVEKVSMIGRMIRDFASNVLDMEGPLPGTTFASSRLFTEEEAEALNRLLEQDSQREEDGR